MASFRGHLLLAVPLGAAYGIAATQFLPSPLDWGVVMLGAGLTVLGGLLPDLDSDSGVPVREMFSLLAAAAPILLFRRLQQWGFEIEAILVILAGLYLLIRFWISGLFKKWTAHRGMFHSIPAVLIVGLLVFLLDRTSKPDPHQLLERAYLAGGMMLGFLSHLLLDELYAIDFEGLTFKPNRFSGSAFKLWSKSRWATMFTYSMLVVLLALAWLDLSASLGLG
jgi:membrane-bound metal-dependent hydrolase YbcI (DUF457 family)